MFQARHEVILLDNSTKNPLKIPKKLKALHASQFSKSEIAANESHKSNFQLAEDPSELLMKSEVLMGNNCTVIEATFQF